MKIKTGIRILFYSVALAFLIHHFWWKICFAIGATEARINLLTHRRIVRTPGPDSPSYSRKGRYWNNEAWDDTTWIADSLVFSKYGFELRLCKEDKNLGFFAQEAGGYCTSASAFYNSGYASVYNGYVLRDILPQAMADAKSVLATRGSDWRWGTSQEEKRFRILFFKQP